MTYDITSPSNERIKRLVRLRDRKHRDAEGVFVVEGERLYSRALTAGLVPIEVFSETGGDGVTSVAPDVLGKASYRSKSEGVIAVFEQFALSLDRIPDTGLLLIVEGIEKPGNLGAMLRTAAAAGVDGLIVVGDSVDPFNPNVVRASTGALFSVPLAVADWDDVERRGLKVLATSPEASTSLWEADLTGPIAVAVGAEDVGLSDRAMAVADEIVVIPQAVGATDSLNASVAAGVVLFEVVRQSRYAKKAPS